MQETFEDGAIRGFALVAIEFVVQESENKVQFRGHAAPQ